MASGVIAHAVEMTDGERSAQAQAPAGEPSLSTQADKLYSEGDGLYRRGEVQGALEKFNQALSLYRRMDDHTGAIKALNLIGRIYYDREQYAKAQEHFEQALAVVQQVGDRRSEGATLNNIGLIYDRQGEYKKALEYLQRALQIRRELHDQPGEGTNLNNLGLAYKHLGQNVEALEHFEQALQIRRELHDQPGEAQVRNNIGTVYLSQGYYKKALEHFSQALPILRQERKRADEGGTLSNLGQCYYGLGQYAEALRYYERALEILRQVGATASIGTVLNNLGQVYDDLGQYEKALAYYEQALPILRQVNRARTAATLSNMGVVYDSLAEYPKALEHYERALEILHDVSDRMGEGTTLDHMGVTYTRMGQYAKALEAFERALAMEREVGNRAGEGTTLSNKGFAYGSMGQYAEALEHYEQALKILPDVGNRAGAGATLNSMGVVYEYLNQPQRALHYYQQSINVQENIRTSARLEEFKMSLAEQSASAYQRAITLLMRLNQPSQAFDLTERARARVFLDELGNTHLDIHKGATVQLIEQEQLLQQDLAALERSLRQESTKPSPQQNAKLAQDLKAQLASKQKAYEDLLTHLKLSNPEYASLVSVSPLTLSAVQKLLDKDTTLLAYFVTTTETLAFLVTRESFEMIELALSEKDLIAMVREFRELVRADPRDVLDKLYIRLITPLKAHLRTPLVGIIPHGDLHYLPFAALITDGQQYFGNEFTLFYLPSASVLPFIQQKRKSSSSSVLALAHSQAEGYPTLRHANQEVQAIATLYNSQALIGSAATESVLRAHAGDYHIVHLAAHGLLEPVQSLFSRIVLAPDKDADGLLEVREVYGLDLKNTSLVVLSACQTQLGARNRGDDLVGLNRAFLYAGTPTVIASLWHVDDEMTSMFMIAFYTHLKAGKSKAEALRAAQGELRAKQPSPYYWAGFVLTGDPGITQSSTSLNR